MIISLFFNVRLVPRHRSSVPQHVCELSVTAHFSIVAADLSVMTLCAGTENPSDSGATRKKVMDARAMAMANMMVKLLIKPPLSLSKVHDEKFMVFSTEILS